ncbi:MAG: hypothetical protein KGL19_10200 [Bacteroidota bacterium]|nr:hypothetical protein [Bacteroidota bacterium]
MNNSSDKVKQLTGWKADFNLKTTDDVREILEHFISDGYAIKHQDNINYQISVSGRLFCEYGGYVQKDIDDKLKLKEIKIDLETRMRNERLLVSAGFLAGFGAVSLVLWEMYKTFCLKLR